MTQLADSTRLPAPIRSLLAKLRWRIRGYVGLHGLALAMIWLGVTFWIGLALDYVPVLMGIGEMPRAARLVMLVMISGVLAVILYRSLLRRLFAKMADRSMAMLLERRFGELGESLITSVELARPLADADSPLGREMLSTTRQQALQQISVLRLRDVFNLRPLTISVTSAIALIATIGMFYVVNAQAWEIGVARLYLLQDQTWPRNARIEIVGVAIKRLGAIESEDARIVPFRTGALKVAKGASLALVVRADAAQRVVPEVCSVRYETADGDYGRVHMTRIGRANRDNFQLYRYEGKPFDGVLSDIEFDVLGFDHRSPPHRLVVVDSPAIVEVKAVCEFPAYMVDPRLSTWLPRTIDITSSTQLPRGTKLRIQARANKPLKQIVLGNPDTSESTTINAASSGDSSSFEFSVPQLGEHLTMDVSLTDTDEVPSDRPFRLHISGIEDTPPLIDMRLRGIGTAVTPNVLVPIGGKITDDYGLARAWLEAFVDDSEPRSFDFLPKGTGETETQLDFQSQRGKPNGLVLQPNQKLHLIVKATDKRDLGSGPNEAAGDHYQLEVVSSEQLLTLLEARELGLRRRFEQIIAELNETRDMLLRVRVDGPAQAAKPASAEPSDAGKVDAIEALKRVWSLRLLRAQQSQLQSQKSAQEVLGVALSFAEIREELINNRVDTEDRKKRLQELIADPLRKIGETQFPELDKRLEALAKQVSVIEASGKLVEEDSATVAAAQAAVDQANQILNDLEAVLQQMLDLESFNELLDIVRGLIDDQEKLLDETKKEQKKAVLDLLK